MIINEMFCVWVCMFVVCMQVKMFIGLMWFYWGLRWASLRLRCLIHYWDNNSAAFMKLYWVSVRRGLIVMLFLLVLVVVVAFCILVISTLKAFLLQRITANLILKMQMKLHNHWCQINYYILLQLFYVN